MAYSYVVIHAGRAPKGPSRLVLNRLQLPDPWTTLLLIWLVCLSSAHACRDKATSERTEAMGANLADSIDCLLL